MQPDDHGLIGDVPVLRVVRQGPEALHFVNSPLEEGQEVHVKVDWVRRFDHMQQHSGKIKSELVCKTLDCNFFRLTFNVVVLLPFLGQHLITALAETMFGYKTTSWCSTHRQ